MTDRTRNDNPATDLLVFGLVGATALVAGGQWLTGNLAAILDHGHPLHVGIDQTVVALGHMPQHPGDPRQAWPPSIATQLPGPILYWTAVAIVTAVAIGVAALVIARLGSRRHEPPDKRRRLGVEAQARLATTEDLAPLLTSAPVPGRFVLAKYKRRLLSTEPAKVNGRRGVQGAVAVFGPSQSGKTTGLIDGATAWTGPAIVSSVKTDLLRATIDARRQLGEVKVFDPLGISGITTATWSPLRAAGTLTGAMVAAQVLARSGGDAGPNDRFWRGQAEQLIASMLWCAANTEGHTMANVVKWVLDLDRPSDDGNGTLSPLVRLLTDSSEPAIALEAHQVQGWLQGQWSTDPRTTSSVYATARNAVWPWADAQVAATAESCDITLDWLTSDANTLYLCAPLGDETRIGAVFAVLLHDLIDQAFKRANSPDSTNGELHPRLLVLLDEAANTPLPKLPQWASTVTGVGIQLVTVWQSKAQLDQTYHQDADTVLTNHRTKLIYPSGLSDRTTVEYISALVGDEHIRADLDNRTAWTGSAADRPSGHIPAATLPLLPAGVLRRAAVGDALLIHGHLPPAWIKSGHG